MSDITTEQFLDLLLREGSPKKLNLSGRDFSEIDLSGEALEELMEEMGLDLATAKWPSWFEPWTKGISLSGANLRDAHFRMADLRNACLEGADLRNADMAGAFLQDATLETADLRQANLTGAVLAHTVLWANFPSLEGARLYGARLQFSPCSQDQFGRGIGEEMAGEWLRAREVYLSLRHNFLDLGRHADASWAYRKEQRMDRAASFPAEEGERWVKDQMMAPRRGFFGKLPAGLRKRLLYLRLFVRPPRAVPMKRGRFLANTMQDALCEYGENPWKLLGWSGALVGFFTVLYFFIDLLAATPVTLQSAAGQPSIFDYFVFSLTSMATMSFARFEPASTLGAFLASVQGILGISLFALFMYTLGRRLSSD